jgi:alpha-L-fucosidase
MKFEPTKESVDKHELPQWYEDAKLGIFIHWSLFSVPAYAPFDGRNVQELLSNEGFSNTMKRNPYAEWYLNSLRIEGSPAQEYHINRYGRDFSYFQFQKEFEESSAKTDFRKWADFFYDSGAKYMVLVTKHHDGYCLWPSVHKNPFDKDYQSKKDLVGALTEEVRKRGMRMGLYYSGLYDWTFKKFPVQDELSSLKHSITGKQHAEYATNHIYELINKYKPDILWNDMGYPSGVNLNRIFADYYNAIPEGVVNDRWGQTDISEDVPDEELVMILNNRKKDPFSENMFKTAVHCDFVTPEYLETTSIQEKKFESTRGLGLSYGFNQMETEKETLSPGELVHMLADVSSKNGNLLINVGPMADGAIPDVQKKPMLELGKWLKVNGEAIYRTRPWKKAQGETACGKSVRFTLRGDTIYMIVLAGNLGGKIVVQDFSPPAGSSIRLLENGKKASFTQADEGISIVISEKMESPYACCFAVEQG